MKRSTVILLCLTALTGAPNLHADVVLDWNHAALNAIRANGTPPPAASRQLAILHVAIYDAVNGIARTHEHYLVPSGVPAAANREAAASAAAHRVMTALYPARQAEYDALHEQLVASLPDRPPTRMGLRWGEKVGAAVLAARSADGSANTAPFPGSLEPGAWRPTESFGGVVRPALLPLWGYVQPFGIRSVAPFRPPPPPALNTANYAEEVNFVKDYGATNSTLRSAHDTETAYFWAYGARTATPPGHWNQIAQSASAGLNLSLEDDARLFALLNIALADAAIVSWECKYVYNYWRPITAIQLADQDGNDATEPDPTWKPLLFTPPFPEYVSGHSTFSGAGATVLAAFFGRDDVSFSVGSDDLPGVIRHYPSFSAAAEESGLSRLLGGIHFMSANRLGLDAGAAIGEEVMTHQLRAKGNRSKK